MNSSASSATTAPGTHCEAPQPSPRRRCATALTERITMHVLVVEDDARLAEALARILEDNGDTSVGVHDGAAGVR